MKFFYTTFEMKRDRCVHLVNIKELINTRNDGHLIISNRLDDKKKMWFKNHICLKAANADNQN